MSSVGPVGPEDVSLIRQSLQTLDDTRQPRDSERSYQSTSVGVDEDDAVSPPHAQ